MHPWTLYALEVTKDGGATSNIERSLIEARATDTEALVASAGRSPSPSPR